MGVISKVKDGRLLLSGEINERLPMVTDGLLVYYPLDGTLNSDRHSLQGIKAYVINMQSSSHTLMNWLINKGVDVTYDDGDGTSWAGWAIFDAISEATLLATYDLIVVDGYVWSISTTHVNKLKSLAEQGMACMGQGNDTRNNVFAISTTAIGTETDNNGTTLDDISYITGVPDGSIVGNTSVDPNFYIDTLSGLCTPLYYHNTVGANGMIGRRFGFDIIYSNNLPFSAKWTPSDQPSDSDTLTIAGVTFTWETSTLTTAGQVKSETDVATSLDNLVAFINNDYTSGTEGYNLTARNRWLLDKYGIVATDGTTYLGIVGYGDIVVACSESNDAWSEETQRPLFGIKGAINMVVQKSPNVVFKEVSNMLGRNVFVWNLYGLKTFEEDKDALVYAKVNTHLWA